MVTNSFSPFFFLPISLWNPLFTQGFAASNMSRLRAEVAAAQRKAVASGGDHTPQF